MSSWPQSKLTLGWFIGGIAPFGNMGCTDESEFAAVNGALDEDMMVVMRSICEDPSTYPSGFLRVQLHTRVAYGISRQHVSQNDGA